MDNDHETPAGGDSPGYRGQHRKPPRRLFTWKRAGQALMGVSVTLRVGDWLHQHDAPAGTARAIVDCGKALTQLLGR